MKELPRHDSSKYLLDPSKYLARCHNMLMPYTTGRRHVYDCPLLRHTNRYMTNDVVDAVTWLLQTTSRLQMQLIPTFAQLHEATKRSHNDRDDGNCNEWFMISVRWWMIHERGYMVNYHDLVWPKLIWHMDNLKIWESLELLWQIDDTSSDEWCRRCDLWECSANPGHRCSKT